MAKILEIDFKKKKLDFTFEEDKESVAQARLNAMSDKDRLRVAKVDALLTEVFDEMKAAGADRDSQIAIKNIFHVLLHFLIRH